MSKWDGPTIDVAICAAQVRWCSGVLQQMWIIKTLTNGDGSIGLEISRREEWRDVPTVSQQEK